MGTFLFVNINYILSFAYIDAVVHCNVPDVWNSALWACVRLRGANGPQNYTYQSSFACECPMSFPLL